VSTPDTTIATVSMVAPFETVAVRGRLPSSRATLAATAVI
jgi:hypothetical protein